MNLLIEEFRLFKLDFAVRTARVVNVICPYTYF